MGGYEIPHTTKKVRSWPAQPTFPSIECDPPLTRGPRGRPKERLRKEDIRGPRGGTAAAQLLKLADDGHDEV
jgi:hypothetical protein